MATDELGNFSIKEDFVVLHNPDGDKPVLKFSYPTVSDYNDDNKSYLTVGGAISLTGGAEIPSNTSSVRAVYIQIADDDGLFTTDSDDSDKTKAENYGFTVVDAYDVINSVAEKAYLRTAAESDTAYVTDDIAKTHGFASRDEFNAWWGIKVTGTTSWRIQLNSKGELNPKAGNLTTNDIKVRACGINALGKMGAWTQENNLIAIHIDNDLPTATAVVNQYADGAINKDNIKADKVVGSVVDNVVYKLPDFTASQNYEADMFLRQQWYLVLDILDDSGIKSISVTDGTNDVTHYKTKWEVKDDSGKVVKSGYKIFVPVDKTKTAVSYTIEAVENGDNAKTSRFKYSFKIDNAAPTLAEIQDSNNKVALSTSKSNTITNSNYVYALSGVSEDDGSGVERVAFYYMRREKITKESLVNGEFVLDPIILAEKDSNNQYYEGNLAIGDNGLTAIPIDGLSKEGEDHAVTDEWLYGKSVTGDVKLNGEVYDTFETTSDLGDHVRVGGLVKINGVFRLIKTKSDDGKSVTFEPSATEKGTNITALFPVAQVIDSNNSPMNNNKDSDNKFTFDSGKDDGDYMPESFTKAGTKWTWDATIHSDNLPDGPATLVILAFDKAGNVSGKRYPVNVANNAPRLAKLHLATDLNGDTKYGDSEFVTYDILTAAGKEQIEYDLVTSALGGTSFIAKDTLGVVPEFTGGNGDISMVFLRDDYGKVDVTNVTGLTSDQIAEIEDGKKYSYKYKTVSHPEDEDEGETQTTVDDYGYRPACYVTTAVGIMSNSIRSTDAYHTSNQKFNGDRGDKTSGSRWIYSLSNAQLTGNDNPAESDDGKNKQISFTFWDSTDECTKGIDSQNCYVRLTDLEVDVTDGEAPKVNIEPFKWEGTGFREMTVDGTTGLVPNNNLYYAKDNAGNYIDAVNGHIEIEGDLPSSTFAADSGEFDGDPKVSGKIVVRGTAYDDVRLDSIWVSFDDFTIENFKSDSSVSIKGTGTGASADTTVMTIETGVAGAGTYSYTAARGGDGKTYYLVAKFDNTFESWNVAAGNANWKFNIVTDVNSKLPDSNGEDKAFFDQRGHRVAWELYFDTAHLTNVAGLDKSVRVMAVDSRGTLPSRTTNATATDEQKQDGKAYAATNKPTYQMDVVPYITEIETELSSGNSRWPTVLSRSALGYYVVSRGSSITINGFNLNGTSTKVDIGTSSDLTPANTSKTNSLDLTIGSDTTYMSGDIVAKLGDATNGYVVSLNNQTAKSVTTGTGENAKTRIIEYNTEPNGQNNDLLTDERKIWVVDVTTTKNTDDKRMLDMAVNENNLYFSAGYGADYFATMRANGTSISNQSYLRQSFTRYFDNALAINRNKIYTLSACGDSYNAVTQWENGPSHFALTKGDVAYGNRWEYGTIGGNYTSNPSNNTSKLYLDSNWNGANLNNLDRFKNPDIVVKTINSTEQGFISYYDSTQKLIKFRYFTPTDNAVASNLTSYQAGETSSEIVEGAVNTNATYSQGYYAIAGADSNSQYSAVGATSKGTALVSWYDAAHGALKMKYNTSPATSFSGYQEFSTAPSYGEITFDLSVDGVSKGNVSVDFSYIDGGERDKHEFAYQLNLELSKKGLGAYAEVDPKSNKVTVRSMQTGTNSSISISKLRRDGEKRNAGSVSIAVAGAGQSWNEVTVDDKSAGQYVAMKTDSKGGIHFAYYDTGNGDLKYAYMSSVSVTPVVVTVDGYQQVGQYVDLALKETSNATANTTSVTPYISYYSMSNADTKRSAKVAKLGRPIVYTTTGTGNTATTTANSASVLAGSSNEMFTGNWEAMHIPTNGIPVQYRVNIGVTSGGNVYISYLVDRIIEYVKVE